jgi:hypothetical protein
MKVDISNVKIAILDAFFYEEETILYVENYLKHHEIQLNRDEIKCFITELFNEGYIKMYDDPSNGIIEFQNSDDDFIEDYWFVLTEEGRKRLIEYRNNNQC